MKKSRQSKDMIVSNQSPTTSSGTKSQVFIMAILAKTYRLFVIVAVAIWTARRVRSIDRPHHLGASAIRHLVPIRCTIFTTFFQTSTFLLIFVLPISPKTSFYLDTDALGIVHPISRNGISVNAVIRIPTTARTPRTCCPNKHRRK